MSIVRICCETYGLSKEERDLAAALWPVLATDEKYPSCEEKYIDIEDIPPWAADIRGISIKPLKMVRFVSPSPNLKNFPDADVREFVKTVNQIVMPGFELLRYGAIQVITDSCTEDIQSELDRGWRIIAVLPQPHQRRPDYVMVREARA